MRAHWITLSKFVKQTVGQRQRQDPSTDSGLIKAER